MRFSLYLLTEPWEEHPLGGAENVFQATEGTEDKQKASSNFKLWAQNLDPHDMLVYTDGSQEIDKTVLPQAEELRG